jgi:hypothetical protein
MDWFGSLLSWLFSQAQASVLWVGARLNMAFSSSDTIVGSWIQFWGGVVGAGLAVLAGWHLARRAEQVRLKSERLKVAELLRHEIYAMLPGYGACAVLGNDYGNSGLIGKRELLMMMMPPEPVLFNKLGVQLLVLSSEAALAVAKLHAHTNIARARSKQAEALKNNFTASPGSDLYKSQLLIQENELEHALIRWASWPTLPLETIAVLDKELGSLVPLSAEHKIAIGKMKSMESVQKMRWEAEAESDEFRIAESARHDTERVDTVLQQIHGSA